MRVNRFYICFVIIMSSVTSVSGQKTDKVLLANGDTLTGEIKSMKLGMLNYDMDGTGTIGIKWEKVKALKSDKVFEILLRSGEILVAAPDSLLFLQRHISLNDIVEMLTIKNRFLKRLYGDIAIGFNYTKSSQVMQFNTSNTVGYRIPKLEIGVATNSFLTKEKRDSMPTKKQDVTLTVIKYFKRKSFTGLQLGWQQNSELGLANRFLLNGVLGKAMALDTLA